MNNKRVPPSVAQFVVSERAELLARITELEASRRPAIAALLRINEEVWPLVHGLTSRYTLRAFMRTLPDVIDTLAGVPSERPDAELVAYIRRAVRIARNELGDSHDVVAKADALLDKL